MDNNNWDIVCAVSCASINTKLKNFFFNLDEVFYIHKDYIGSLEVEFDTFEIIPGGDGQQIIINMPIAKGVLDASDWGRIDISKCCPQVMVELAFFNADNGDDHTVLKFNFSQLADIPTMFPKMSGKGDVFVLDGDINNLLPNFSYKNELGRLLGFLLVEQLQHRLSFSFYDLFPLPQDHPISALKLQLIQYAYRDAKDAGLGGLAVMGILDNNSHMPLIEDLPLTFDLSLIRDQYGNDSACIVLSRRAFMECIILPLMPKLLGGLDESDISHLVVDENGVIKNNDILHLGTVKGYPLVINDLQVIPEEKNIKVTGSGLCTVVPNSSRVEFILSGTIHTEMLTNAECSVLIANILWLDAKAFDDNPTVFWVFGGETVELLVDMIKDDINKLVLNRNNVEFDFSVQPISPSIPHSHYYCFINTNFYMQEVL